MSRHTSALQILLIGSLVGGCSGSIVGGGPGDDDGSGSGSGSGSGTGSGSDEPIDNPDPVYPTEHPRIYLTPNRARLEAALTAHTPASTRFKQKVDSWVGGADIWGFQAWNGALLGQLTGDAKYCAKSIEVVEAQVTAAESKIASGEQPEVAGDSYLGIGELVGDLALVYDWCFDSLQVSQRDRWLAYANQAVWNVWHPSQAKWGNKTMAWSGWSVDNPSNNYYYSFLRATMLLGLAAKDESPQADEWIVQFHDTKVMAQLVPTFDSDLVGGGSREGTGYGVSMRRLFELYDFWHATTGEILAIRTKHTRASLLSFMHQMVPTLDRFAPTGDQARDSTAAFFDYHRNYLQELVAEFSYDDLAGRAKAMLDQSSLPQMGQGFMLAYDFLYDNDVASKPLDGLGTDYYAPGIGELYSRSGWDKQATWVNMIAGPYTESHAHQDQGSLMIYKGGWLAYDSVVSSQSGLVQDTTAHGLVRIDRGGSPVRQVASTTSKVLALHRGDGWFHTAADLTPAYKNDTAVQKVQRELVYLKPDVIVVFDRVSTASDTTQTWQLATPVQPSVDSGGATISNAGHTLRVNTITGGSGSTYSYASGSDYNGGFRFDEQQAGGNRQYLHVLSIDGAAQSISGSGSSVTFTSGGHAYAVTFDPTNVGGTLSIDGASIALSAVVETLPE